jgi:hypothetical protein
MSDFDEHCERLGSCFAMVAVNPFLVTQNDVFFSFYVFINVCTVKKFLTDFKTLLFLLVSQQTWHKFGCNTLHTQIFNQKHVTFTSLSNIGING